MHPESRPAYLAENLEHLFHHWESQRKSAEVVESKSPKPRRPFTIAISGEAGTQSSLVAREAGRRLGWQVYDRELLELIGQDMGVRAALLESVDQRRQSWILEAAQGLLAAPMKSDWGALVSQSGYVHHLINTVLALGAHGECVIVGRGAGFILPSETTLRVRLIGLSRQRIAALSHNLGVSEREAARKVRTIDREQAHFIKDYFTRDVSDPRNFDMLLNVSRFTVPLCAQTIVEALHGLE
jgi:cytidylate kinase